MLKKEGVKKLPREGIEKILVRGTNWIGDAVLTLPAVAAIRATYPKARIELLAKPWVAEVYKLFSDVDDVLSYEKTFDSPWGVLRLGRELKKSQFDLAILLQNAIEAAILAFTAGIPLRAGYDTDGRGLLLTHRVRRTPAVKRIHQADYYLEMVRALGCEPVGHEIKPMSADEHAKAEKVLQRFLSAPEEGLVGIAPGATYGEAKKWLPERFAAVMDALHEAFSVRGMILGSQSDRQAARAVQERARTELVNLAGKTTLREAIYLISRCRLFISNDSGLMHLAGAMNVPTVAIFGSTNPVTTAPLGKRVAIVYKQVACSPCLKRKCPTDFRCMEGISAEEVISVARGLLLEGRGEKP